MKKVLLAAAAFIVAVSSISVGANARQGTSVVLSKDSLRTVGKVQCGKVRGAWLAGTHLKRNRFISHQSQSKALADNAKRATGQSKKLLLTESKRFRSLSRSQTRKCRLLTVPRGYRLPLMNMDRSVGVGVKPGRRGVAKSSTQGGKQLVKIDDQGSMIPALVYGDPKIKRVFTTQSGRMFLYTDIHLEGSEMSRWCVLYEVSRWNGTMNCVDRRLAQLDFLETEGMPESMYSPIQVDAAGAVYYTGHDIREIRHGLKKYHRGKSVYVYSSTQHVELTFLALDDGRILLSKRADLENSPSQWLRLIHPSGKTETLLNEYVGPMQLFPDGNVYFTPQDSHYLGMRRFLSASNTIDPLYWTTFSGTMCSSSRCTAGPSAHHVLPSASPELPSQVSKWIAPSDDNMYALMFNEDPNLLSWCYGCKFPGSANRLYRAYPTPKAVSTSLAHVEDAVSVPGGLVLSGERSPGQFATVFYDSATASESELVSPQQSIRIEFMTYISESNTIVFYGQDMASKKWITGTIDLLVKTIAVASRSDAPLNNLQSLSIG